MSRIISREEVKKHHRCDSTWIIIANKVYDVTSFLEEHPGGADSLLEVAGQDGTRQFEDVGHSEDARKLLKKYYIGDLPVSEAGEGSSTRRSPAGSRPRSRGSRSPSGSSQRSVKQHSCVKPGLASPRRPRAEERRAVGLDRGVEPCMPRLPSPRVSTIDTCPPRHRAICCPRPGADDSWWWVKYAIGGVVIAIIGGLVYRKLSSPSPPEPLIEPAAPAAPAAT
ncbi:NADH-cytochrome b5 reductase-like protein alnC isoform X2 [Plutella xylostella]|uniref:NADH-cytochrome b5 reductase-like protein alnC isoform X2 n=1 Tax=Plutella xylostella TaxID=51655 RepID=UPI002032B36F|nr:NADH-cytochrome b5 reductase-like protein alnC isoform X2 [Plutella xylostella]